MGGASTQITFNPAVDALAGKFPVIIAGRVYPLYTHSYLGYGQETVIKYIREELEKESPGENVLFDPCALTGKRLLTFPYMFVKLISYYIIDREFSRTVKVICSYLESLTE